MKRQIGVALCLAWAVLCCLAGPSEAVKFRYEDLGTLGGTHTYGALGYKELDINDAGQVVGFSATSSGAIHGFVKSPGHAMVDLGDIPGSAENRASCINNQGTIGGWCRDRVFVYKACEWLKIGDVYQSTVLLDDASFYGINDAGYLVGKTKYPRGAIVKTPGGFVSLPPILGEIEATATGINSANTLVGFSLATGSLIPTACFWPYSNGSYSWPTSLFGITNSKAFAINNLGQAVGTAVISGAIHAVLKSPGEDWQDLGNLGNSHAYAYGINDSGWVVGHTSSNVTAFLWMPREGMQDLNNLVVNLPGGVHLNYAFAINKRGEIAGYTSNSVFKLTPIVNPPFSLLLSD